MLNIDQKEVFNLVTSEWAQVIGLTGAGGSGKTYLMGELAKALPSIGLCPTGTATENLVNHGVENSFTIHKFFNYRQNSAHPKGGSIPSLADKGLWDDIRLVICDETSMIGRGLFQSLLNLCLKDGKILLYVGDPHQLQPIRPQNATVAPLYNDTHTNTPVSPQIALQRYYTSVYATPATPYYFDEIEPPDINYDDVIWKTMHLHTPIRTKGASENFMERLDEIRHGSVSAARGALATLKNGVGDPTLDDAIHLTCTNNRAQEINDSKMPKTAQIPLHKKRTTGFFIVKKRGSYPDEDWFYEPNEKGSSSTQYPDDLYITMGSKVIITKNIYHNGVMIASNGTSGHIINYDAQNVYIRTDNGIVEIAIETEATSSKPRHSRFFDTFDEAQSEADKHRWTVDYSCPIQGGYAMTIHKAQGHTFDRVHIEADSPPMLEHTIGLAYVALSRATGGDINTTFDSPQLFLGRPRPWATAANFIHEDYKRG